MMTCVKLWILFFLILRKVQSATKEDLCGRNPLNLLCVGYDKLIKEPEIKRDLQVEPQWETKKKIPTSVTQFTSDEKQMILKAFNSMRNEMAKGDFESKHSSDAQAKFPKASRMYQLVSWLNSYSNSYHFDVL